MEGHLSLNFNKTSEAKVWFRAAMQVAVGERAPAPEKLTNTLESADSLLSHGEITGDFKCKTTKETNFLLVMSTTESQHARKFRVKQNNKEALQVKCKWKQKIIPKINTAADTDIVHCGSQGCLSLLANEELSADMHMCSMQNLEKEVKVLKWWSLAS